MTAVAPNRVKLAAADPFVRRLFEGLAEPVLKATMPAPQRTRVIANGIADRGTTRWVLDGLASVQLVELRGTDWWRRTPYGDDAVAGKPPPDGWPTPAAQGDPS